MGYRIFLSYGHDEHSDLARALKRDLEARGHEVWFDEDRLMAGTDWETRIEQGLQWAASEPDCGRVVLLITPHSVRRPDGYCLNELARAISRGLPIVPLMAVWSEPPLSICRIQWLDLRDCLPLGAQPAAYQRRVDQLTTALAQDGTSFEGAQARLMALLDPLPFGAEINEHLARFTGRDWIFQKIDHWLADAGAEKIFWITGGPGVGKTALAAKLSATRPDIVAVHFCQAGHTQKGDPRRCVLSIVYQLSTQLPEYESRLNALPLQSIITESDARTLFDRLILQPLAANFPDPGRMLVVLIDALDEATQEGRNALASFLGAEFPKTPPWLRLIITSRPDPEVTYPLQAITADVIDVAASENESDIRAFLQRELKSHLLDVRHASAIVDSLIRRSEGNFLYVEWLRREIMAGRVSLADPGALPQGMGGVYAQFAARQWPDVGTFKKDIGPVLDIVAAAREPLTLAFLGEMFDWSERQQIDFQDTLGSLFILPDGRIIPFHKSLLDWLTDRSKSGRYFVSAADGNRRLTEYCVAQYEKDPLALPGYVRGHLPAHLIADKLEAVLTNLAFLEAKTAAAGVFAIVADFADALAAIPPGRPLETVLKGNNANRTESVVFSPDGAVVLSGGGWGYRDNQYLYVWGWRAGELLRRITAHTSLLHQVRFAPDGNRFASCSGDAAGEYTIKIWDVATAAARALKGHTGSIQDIGFSPDGSRMISGSWDETVRLWDTVSGAPLLKIDIGSQVNCVGFLADGRRVYSGGYDNVVRIWDSLVGIAAMPTRPDGRYNLWRLVYSPDGKYLATGSERGAVVLWDANTGRLARELRPGVGGPVTNIVFSPDGGHLAVGTGNVPWDFDEPWSGDSDFDIRVFDVATGTLAGTLSGIGHKVSLHALRYSADGSRIITPLDGAPTVVWDAKSFRRIEGGTAERAAPETAAANRPVGGARIKARVAAPETVFTDQVSGRDIAWLSQPLYEATLHPGGTMWAGRSDDVHAHQNDARKIDMVVLEGYSTAQSS